MSAVEPDDEEPSPRLTVAELQQWAGELRAKAPAPTEPVRSPIPGLAEAEAVAKRNALGTAWARMVPSQFAEARLSDFSHCVEHVPPADGCADCTELQAMRDLLITWTRQAEGQNLVIVGPVGTGKTHAGFAAARVVFGEGESVAYYPVGELLRALHWEEADSSAVMKRACSIGLLFLDDLGVERSNDWAQDQLYDIINARWSNDLPMIVTSNLEPDDLREHLGKQGRSYSRLRDNAIGVRLGGDDRRGRNA